MEIVETTKETQKPRIIVFDVYETLLDMSEVERKINLITDSKRGYILWFELFMEYCFANNSLDTFHDFFSIARATLQMAGVKLGRTIPDSEADDTLQILKHLPVREGVPSCLSELNDDNFTVIALTNAPEKLVYERMERTGLVSYFETVLSAESIKKYKPEKKVYEWAAQKLNVQTGEMLMVSTHGWDIAGAANAGMKTALLKSDKQLLFPLSAKPDMVGTLSEIVSILKSKK
jgi:2-haloacid dehalogenase